jgi:hypothetical protein
MLTVAMGVLGLKTLFLWVASCLIRSGCS